MGIKNKKRGGFMFLKQIKLSNFRNYEHLQINFSPNINIIYGDNAQGKTNLLESIYFLSVTKSHHSFLDNRLIKDGETELKVEGMINNLITDTKYSINLNESKKELKIDDKIIKKVSEYISNINIIIFYPDDLNLIKGSPNDRRRYINVQLSQLSSKYFEASCVFGALYAPKKVPKASMKLISEAVIFTINELDINFSP